MPATQHARAIARKLYQAYTVGPAFLNFETPWQLLVSTVLSAQCTDERVNKVTPGLFARWPGPEDMMQAAPQELEEAIRSTGLFRNKTKNLLGASQLVVREYGGNVPQTMKDLLRLPGVARKTANIVLTQGFGIVEGIAVDTHVKRLAHRLGLSEAQSPDKVEKDLCAAFERTAWGDMNHLLILHGRTVCLARTPQCSRCMLVPECPKKGVKSSA
jgi:endonuclease-3